MTFSPDLFAKMPPWGLKNEDKPINAWKRFNNHLTSCGLSNSCHLFRVSLPNTGWNQTDSQGFTACDSSCENQLSRPSVLKSTPPKTSWRQLIDFRFAWQKLLKEDFEARRRNLQTSTVSTCAAFLQRDPNHSDWTTAFFFTPINKELQFSTH